MRKNQEAEQNNQKVKPFERKAGKEKRHHQFAENVRQNHQVSKKAGS